MRLAILGAGGHGRVVADLASLIGYDQIAVFDDLWPYLPETDGWSVLGNTEAMLSSELEFDGIAVAIGDNETRIDKLTLFVEAGFCMPPLIHPRAYVSKNVCMGEGTVVMAGAILQTGSALGRGCIINTSSTVDHDCFLDDGVHIAPGAHLAGSVTVGKYSTIGVGASVIQNRQLGTRITVAAGACVVDDVLEGQCVMGVPAKAI